MHSQLAALHANTNFGLTSCTQRIEIVPNLTTSQSTCAVQRKLCIVSYACPLHISRSDACPDAVGSANVNGFPTRNRLSGPHRETIGRPSGGRRAILNKILNMFNIARRRRPIRSRTCTTQLRVVINKAMFT